MAKIYTCDECGKELNKRHFKLDIGRGSFNGFIETPPDPMIDNPIPMNSYQFCNGKCLGKWVEREGWSYTQDNEEEL